MVGSVNAILVVDDEPDMQSLMRQRFRRRIRRGDLAFHFATNGDDALKLLEANPDIAVVMSDINMPGMDGLTLLDHVCERYSDIRTVMVTAYGDMGNIRAAMHRGAIDFVNKPIDFDDLDRTLDRALAAAERLKQAREAEQRLSLIGRELEIASRMQLSVLPGTFPSDETHAISGMMLPAKEVGGDFYDFFWLEDGRVALLIADSAGKGVPAALFMMMARSVLKTSVISNASPGQAMQIANDLLCRENRSDMFITVFLAVADLTTGAVTYVNAGHNPPVMVPPDAALPASPIPVETGIALGAIEEFPFEEQTLTLEPGASLFLFTDGVTEAINAAEEEFGEHRLEAALTKCAGRRPSLAVDYIRRAIGEFTYGTEQSDDITCLAFHFRGPLSGGGADSRAETVTLPAEKESLKRFADWMETTSVSLEIDAGVTHALTLALDELITNAISHGFPGRAPGHITVTVERAGDRVTATLRDDGIAHDPFAQAPDPDLDLGIEEREIGGLGVFLVRELMDRADYRREGDFNIITLTKSLSETDSKG